MNDGPEIPIESVSEMAQTLKQMKTKPDELFQQIRAKKTELSHARKYLKELVMQEPGAEEAKQKQQDAKAHLDAAQERTENRNPTIIEKIEELKAEIKADEDLLNDVLLNKMAKAIHEEKDIQLKLFDEEKNPHIAIPTFFIRPMKKGG